MVAGTEFEDCRSRTRAGRPGRGDALVPELEAGAVFVDEVVKSDPRLPFDGGGDTGYGSELSHYGIREFTDEKTVWVE